MFFNSFIKHSVIFNSKRKSFFVLEVVLEIGILYFSYNEYIYLLKYYFV